MLGATYKPGHVAGIRNKTEIERAAVIGEAVAGVLTALLRPVQSWVERQRAYRELAALDDRMLADIGLTRAEIPATIAKIGEPANDSKASVAA